VATKETDFKKYLVKTTETLGGLFVFVLFIAIFQSCRGGAFCLFVSSCFLFSCHTLSRTFDFVTCMIKWRILAISNLFRIIGGCERIQLRCVAFLLCSCRFLWFVFHCHDQYQ
jgi:hypothetical protein